jgi:ABC-type polysaccharide/polyol phosphate transport system ATPase subunit
MRAIVVENVSKRFLIGETNPRKRIRDLGGLLCGSRREVFWALRDVGFEVEQGEAIGIIGHNGAGKSTMLKILTGIIEPTEGRVRTRGRVSALIEVGAGFHPEMTGRENIYLNGTILGMTRAEISRKLDDIIAFAELEGFIDTPVKRYSSGMFARLGYSVAAHVEPQVLLVDEVLAVGDLAFQQKCFQHMHGLVSRGCAVILVTHSMHSAKQLCGRLVWMHKGQVKMTGPADEVAGHYQSWANNRLAQGTSIGSGFRWGAGGATIHGVVANVRSSANGRSADVSVEMDVETGSELSEPILWVMLTNADGQKIAGTTSRRQPGLFHSMTGSHHIKCNIRNAPLMPGLYQVAVGVFDRSLVPLDRWGNATSFVIEAHPTDTSLITPDFDGPIWVDSDWEASATTGSTTGNDKSGN